MEETFQKTCPHTFATALHTQNEHNLKEGNKSQELKRLKARHFAILVSARVNNASRSLYSSVGSRIRAWKHSIAAAKYYTLAKQPELGSAGLIYARDRMQEIGLSAHSNKCSDLLRTVRKDLGGQLKESNCFFVLVWLPIVDF